LGASASLLLLYFLPALPSFSAGFALAIFYEIKVNSHKKCEISLGHLSMHLFSKFITLGHEIFENYIT